MTVKLKWDGDSLMLGRTKMAEVVSRPRVGVLVHAYILGPEDFVSDPYQSKDDARQDCKAHVRRLLANAGAPDA